jgi:HEPN domain-containing protein
MAYSKKDIRDIAGITFDRVGLNPDHWAERAYSFKSAADLIASANESSPPIPYYYNAGLSLELILKAIATAKGIGFEKSHDLNSLCRLIGIDLTEDQRCTLELLSEIIVWSGRYPVPKSEGAWNNYHDNIQEKHIVRKHEGGVSLTMANRSRFPNLENYLTLWNIFNSAFNALKFSAL